MAKRRKKAAKKTVRKTARKKTARKKVAKKAVKKKTVRKKTPVKKAVGKDKTALKTVVKSIVTLMDSIEKKEKAVQKKLDSLQKKMFSSKNKDLHLKCVFEMEGLKLESFKNVEKEYVKMSQDLNKAYKHAQNIGGLIFDDFLNVVQDLSNGINLPLMKKDLKKLYRDIT